MTGSSAKSQARHIVDILGGRTKTAELLEWPITKVDSVLRTGFFRCQDQRDVLERAWAAGININELDFVVHLRGLTRPVPTPERLSA